MPLEWQYGIQVFDLCVDQICTLMERPDMNIGMLQLYKYKSCCNHSSIHFFVATELGAVPSMQYSVMGGGRLYPVVSREVGNESGNACNNISNAIKTRRVNYLNTQ